MTLALIGTMKPHPRTDTDTRGKLGRYEAPLKGKF